VKPFAWNEDKNRLLQTERGIAFEEVLAALASGALLDVVEHPNKDRYPNQRIFIVEMRAYAWLVPFVETENEIFMKTIIPSRKATRQYLGGENDSV
jgi:uncharacterized DUF497 family protein